MSFDMRKKYFGYIHIFFMIMIFIASNEMKKFLFHNSDIRDINQTLLSADNHCNQFGPIKSQT